VPEIDGLRFAAIASVVLYHLHGFLPNGGAGVPLDSAIDHGYRGVNLFYVISGFILGLPFAAYRLRGAPPVSIRAYFLRRLTRLEPPYILNLLVYSVLLLAATGTNWAALLPHLAASMVYLHNLVYGAQSTINAVAWTLEVEVQFYCLMPLLALLFTVRSKPIRRAVLVASILLCGVAQLIGWGAPPRAKLSILFAIQFFLAGMLLADVHVTDWQGRPNSDWRWDLLSFALWPVIFLLPDRAIWVFLPCLILAAYVAAFRGVLFRAIFRNGLITAIGGMCYTIYLFHYQLIPLVVTPGGRPVPQVILYFLVLALVSAVYFLAIERPCMAKDWPRRLAMRVARRVPAASSVN
jgi:peptidoglycan/LPS O-acetylase OafA/YrhL